MKTKLLFLILLASTQINAQQYTDQAPQPNQKDEVKSLLNADNDITGFGNIDFRLSSIKSTQTLLMGMYGGLVINRTVMLGLAGYGIASKVDFMGTLPGTATVDKLNLYGGYGGIVIGAMVASNEVVHLSFPIVLAAGNLDVSDDDFFDSFNSDRSYIVESSKFFVIEPTAQLELNISKSFRIGLGGSYRFVQALELQNVSDKGLSGFTGVLSFKFGGF